MMRYFSTFSGMGGFELGIQRALDNRRPTSSPTLDKNGHISDPDISDGDGGRSNTLCVGYSEIDKYAIQTYERRFNHDNYGDITKLDTDVLPDFELLVGGFPCQAFSVAGKRRGFEDTRGTLFFDLARILKDKRPRHFVFENVKGLLSHEQGKTFQTILGVLTDLGYRVEWQVLNSKDFGVPQNRERVYFVGHLRGECGRKVFPLAPNDGMGVIEGEVANTLTANYWKGPAASRPFVATTLRAHQGGPNQDDTFVEPTESRIRKLTPRECERLQGFPDDWTAGVSDTQRYKQCGNAVTVNTVATVMNALKECLV